MNCPKCGAQNVTVTVVNDVKLKDKHHGFLWWLCVGWYWVPFKWLFLTLPALIFKIFSHKKQKVVSKQRIFDYITYEILGGEEPEIFIRLNDPNKVRQIAMGEMYYSNSYVSKAKQKHDRDVEILLRFFDKLQTDTERWDYIESYFLGKDVLLEKEPLPVSNVKMSAAVDKEHSYASSRFDSWDEIISFFDENERILINKLISKGIKIPEYLQTVIKRSDAGNDILMSWPSRLLARTIYFDTMQPFALKTSETVRNSPKLSERVRNSPTEYVLNIRIECST